MDMSDHETRSDQGVDAEVGDDSDIFSAESEDEEPVRTSESLVSSSRFGLRNMRLWTPVSFGLVPLYDKSGVLGLLDPVRLYWYRRLHGEDDLACAHEVFNAGHFVTELNCTGAPDDPQHNHPGLTLPNLRELRFRLVLRALFAALRADIHVSELNLYACYHHERIFPGDDEYPVFKYVPRYLRTCAETGYVYPGDHVLFASRIRVHGMQRRPLRLDRALMKFVSHVEWTHFRSLDHLFTPSVDLDCPTVVDEVFPKWDEPYTFGAEKDHLRK